MFLSFFFFPFLSFFPRGWTFRSLKWKHGLFMRDLPWQAWISAKLFRLLATVFFWVFMCFILYTYSLEVTYSRGNCTQNVGFNTLQISSFSTKRFQVLVVSVAQNSNFPFPSEADRTQRCCFFFSNLYFVFQEIKAAMKERKTNLNIFLYRVLPPQILAVRLFSNNRIKIFDWLFFFSL